MVIKPQDVLVALQLSLRPNRLSYAALGEALGLSASEAHAAVRRLIEARLVDPETQMVRREPLHNFLVHGVPYVFPVSPKGITRGVPTAWAAPAMSALVQDRSALPPVWPDPDGKVQGQAITPLYPSVPAAARRSRELYDLLAYVDALRIGRARERKFAENQITEHMTHGVA
jgi:hypothetical protein